MDSIKVPERELSYGEIREKQAKRQQYADKIKQSSKIKTKNKDRWKLYKRFTER